MRPLICICFFSFVLACGDNVTHQGEPEEIEKLLEEFESQPEVQTFNEGLESDSITIEGKYGTTLKFYKGFCDFDTGKVVFELEEYYSMKDFIFNDLTTTADGKLLESGGMIKVIAKINEEKITINSGFAEIDFRDEFQGEDRALFYGNEDTTGVLNWTLGYRHYVIYDEGEDSLAEQILNEMMRGNGFPLGQLGWVNLDRYVPCEQETDVIVNANHEEINYFLVFDKYNSLVRGTIRHGEVLFEGVPAGESATIVALGTGDDDKQYYSLQDINTSDEGLEGLALKEVEPSELDKILNEKFGNVLDEKSN